MPAGRGQLGVLHLRPLEVGRRRVVLAAPHRPAPVEDPVPEAERDHVRAPDRHRLVEQLAAARLVAADQRHDQRDAARRALPRPTAWNSASDTLRRRPTGRSGDADGQRQRGSRTPRARAESSHDHHGSRQSPVLVRLTTAIRPAARSRRGRRAPPPSATRPPPRAACPRSRRLGSTRRSCPTAPRTSRGLARRRTGSGLDPVAATVPGRGFVDGRGVSSPGAVSLLRRDDEARLVQRARTATTRPSPSCTGRHFRPCTASRSWSATTPRRPRTSRRRRSSPPCATSIASIAAGRWTVAAPDRLNRAIDWVRARALRAESAG